MTHGARACLVLLACALMAPPDAGAQRQRALSLDVSIGSGSSHTAGEYTGDAGGPAVDVTLALRRRPVGSGALVVGLSAASQGQAAHDAVCVVSPGGDCMPYFPSFGTVGMLAGWENAGATLRAMGGPAYVHGDDAGAIAVQGRLDGALPVARRLALVASVRGTMIPRYRGDAFGLFAFGAGIRIR